MLYQEKISGFLSTKYRNKIILVMLTVHPQYITDNTGKKISVVLPMKEFKTIMEELESWKIFVYMMKPKPLLNPLSLLMKLLK